MYFVYWNAFGLKWKTLEMGPSVIPTWRIKICCQFSWQHFESTLLDDIDRFLFIKFKLYICHEDNINRTLRPPATDWHRSIKQHRPKIYNLIVIWIIEIILNTTAQHKKWCATVESECVCLCVCFLTHHLFWIFIRTFHSLAWWSIRLFLSQVCFSVSIEGVGLTNTYK